MRYLACYCTEFLWFANRWLCFCIVPLAEVRLIVSGCTSAKLLPEGLFSVLYGERCLSNSVSKKQWKSISVGCAAGVTDSSASKTKGHDLHIYVYAFPDQVVDSALIIHRCVWEGLRQHPTAYSLPYH